MKKITVARDFTYRLKCILLVFILMNGMSEMLAAQARPQDPTPIGIFQRLIKIKYNTELYLITAAEHSDGTKTESLDSALAIYNTIRWNMDGLVYQLSGDLVAANSPKKLRRLNDWCLKESLIFESSDRRNGKDGTSTESTTLKNIEDYCQESLPAFSPIGKTARDEGKIGDIGNLNNPKNINLTTNVFYLIKDSYSLIKGLSDLKTQKTMALVEILDQMRLASPQELLKQVK